MDTASCQRKNITQCPSLSPRGHVIRKGQSISAGGADLYFAIYGAPEASTNRADHQNLPTLTSYSSCDICTAPTATASASTRILCLMSTRTFATFLFSSCHFYCEVGEKRALRKRPRAYRLGQMSSHAGRIVFPRLLLFLARCTSESAPPGNKAHCQPDAGSALELLLTLSLFSLQKHSQTQLF